MTQEHQVHRLLEILRSMDIPQFRRVVDPDGLKWLGRNIGIANGNHPDLEEALDLMRKLSVEEVKS